MKKLTGYRILLVCFLHACSVLMGQTEENFNFNSLQVKHLKGIKGIELNYGGGGNAGKYLQGMFTMYHKDKWMGGIGLNMEDVSIGITHVKDYLVRYTSYFTVANIKQRLYFNITAGVFAGMETIYPYTSSDGTFVFSKTNKFLYGGALGGNIEFYLVHRFSITATGEQFYNPASPLGAWKFNVLGGLRVYFN